MHNIMLFNKSIVSTSLIHKVSLISVIYVNIQALLSHNNLHIGNIFVRETTWCWKIAGFECTLELTRVDAKVCSLCVLCGVCMYVCVRVLYVCVCCVCVCMCMHMYVCVCVSMSVCMCSVYCIVCVC